VTVVAGAAPMTVAFVETFVLDDEPAYYQAAAR
jgi:hypothetical protein